MIKKRNLIFQLAKKFITYHSSWPTLIKFNFFLLLAKQNDCSEKCRLTLLLIKKFPEAVKECGVSSIFIPHDVHSVPNK